MPGPVSSRPPSSHLNLPSACPRRRAAGRLAIFAVWLGAAMAVAPSGCSSEPDDQRDPAIDTIVLISIDACRIDHIGCYGSDAMATPRLDDLAREAVRFQHVVAPVPLSEPAHRALLSGRMVAGPAGRAGSAAEPTIAEVLRDQGFTCGAIVSSSRLAAAHGFDAGFETYDDAFGAPTDGAAAGERTAGQTARLARAWLDAQAGKRSFLFLHFSGPHEPHAPPEPFASRFAPYAGEIAAADQAIGRVIDDLRALGRYDTSLLVVTADHGTMLGERGERGHGYYLYEPAVRVPLIIRAPRHRSGGVVTDTVGLIDVAPTICGLLGVDPPGGANGRDLSPLLNGRSRRAADTAYFCQSLTPRAVGAGPLLGVVVGKWKYLHGAQPQLYDLEQDPGERTNLAADRPQRVADMRDRLRGVAAPWLDEAASGIDPRDVLDLYQARQDVDRLLQDGRLDEAESRCSALVERHATLAAGHVVSARVAAARGDHASALAMLESALDVVRDKAMIHAAIGRSLGAVDQWDRAVEHLQQALALSSDAPAAHGELARALVASGDIESARAHARTAIEFAPGSAEAHCALGEVLLADRRTDAAIEQAEAALRLAPGHADAYCLLGRARAARGQGRRAIERFRQAVASDPNHFASRLHLGNALTQAQQPAEAETHLRAAVALRPGTVQARRRLAAALQALERFEDAVAHLERADGLAPDDAETQFCLGAALVGAGRLSEAVDRYERAVRLRPKWPPPMNDLAWLFATRSVYGVQERSRAIDLAEKAVELTRGRDPTVLDTLAATYAATTQYELATMTAERALELVRSARQLDLEREIAGRLALYRAGQPYRVDP